MRLSQMPRERRPDLAPERAALARPAEPFAEVDLEPPRPGTVDLQPSEPATVEVVVEPVEVHLRRAPDWKRVLAWVVDGLPFGALFAFTLHLALDRLPHATPLDLSTALDLAGAEASAITGPIFAGTLVLFVVYHLLAHGLYGATLGKRLFGIRVVGRDGERPGLGRATVRAVLAATSLLLLGLGVLLALFTRSGRGLHDLLARTWVVEAP
jgi:uncharacterized RDD family membrane protein YckC